MKDFSYQEEFYDSLGLEHFAISLTNTDRIRYLSLSENDLGPKNFSVLQPIFIKNIYIQTLNLADCKLDGPETVKLCDSLLNNKVLKHLYMRNCEIGDLGASSLAKLVGDH